MVLEVFEEWGARLAAGAVLYALIAMMITYGYITAGLEPPQLVPSKIYEVYAKLSESWSKVEGLLSGNPLVVAVTIGSLIVDAGLFAAALFGTIAVAYVWIAVMAASALPGPLRVLAPMLWAAGFIANAVTLAYLLRKLYELIRSLPIPFVST